MGESLRLLENGTGGGEDIRGKETVLKAVEGTGRTKGFGGCRARGYNYKDVGVSGLGDHTP